jgi:hypothetical protein
MEALSPAWPLLWQASTQLATLLVRLACCGMGDVLAGNRLVMCRALCLRSALVLCVGGFVVDAICLPCVEYACLLGCALE